MLGGQTSLFGVLGSLASAGQVFQQRIAGLVGAGDFLGGHGPGSSASDLPVAATLARSRSAMATTASRCALWRSLVATAACWSRSRSLTPRSKLAAMRSSRSVSVPW